MPESLESLALDGRAFLGNGEKPAHPACPGLMEPRVTQSSGLQVFRVYQDPQDLRDLQVHLGAPSELRSVLGTERRSRALRDPKASPASAAKEARQVPWVRRVHPDLWDPKVCLVCPEHLASRVLQG